MAFLSGAIHRAVGALIASAAIDVTGVYDQNFRQVFSRARPLKAMVKEESTPMEHPLETGALSTDHRIILQTEIELSLVLQAEDYRDVYQQIKQLWLSGELLTVQSKTGIYENQMIIGIAHDEDAEVYDAVIIALKLKEVLFAISNATIVPKDPTDTSTKQRGNQQTEAATPQETQKGSAFWEAFFK